MTSKLILDPNFQSFSPIKVPQYFKTINVDAARTKINEFSSASGASLSQAEQKTLNEVYSQLKLPGIASLDAGFSENYDPATLLALVMKWPEDKRFPRKLPFRHAGELDDLLTDVTTNSNRPVSSAMRVKCIPATVPVSNGPIICGAAPSSMCIRFRMASRWQ
jgi:hypothetical protein